MSLLVAHRGQKSSFPENTLESIHQAISCGAMAVEFDVQMTADYIPVICHDASLLKSAGVDINITEVKYTDIKDISVGEPARFAEKYQSVTLPSLQDMVVMLQASPQVMVFVELKNSSMDVFGVKCFVEHVSTQLEPIKQRCVVIADNLQALLILKQQTSIPIGWIIHRWIKQDFSLAKRSQIEYLVINYKYYSGQQHDFAADSWRWVIYETSDPDRALALFDSGVDFVETDNICFMLNHLSEDK